MTSSAERKCSSHERSLPKSIKLSVKKSNCHSISDLLKSSSIQILHKLLGSLSWVTMVDYITSLLCFITFSQSHGTLINGSHFIVAAEHFSPFFEVNSGSPDKPYSGVMLQLLEYVRLSLNFTYEIRRPPDGQWGFVHKNRTVTGMVGMVSRNEVDFALGEHQCFVTRFLYCLYQFNFQHIIFIKYEKASHFHNY